MPNAHRLLRKRMRQTFRWYHTLYIFAGILILLASALYEYIHVTSPPYQSMVQTSIELLNEGVPFEESFTNFHSLLYTPLSEKYNGFRLEKLKHLLFQRDPIDITLYIQSNDAPFQASYRLLDFHSLQRLNLPEMYSRQDIDMPVTLLDNGNSVYAQVDLIQLSFGKIIQLEAILLSLFCITTLLYTIYIRRCFRKYHGQENQEHRRIFLLNPWTNLPNQNQMFRDLRHFPEGILMSIQLDEFEAILSALGPLYTKELLLKFVQKLSYVLATGEYKIYHISQNFFIVTTARAVGSSELRFFLELLISSLNRQPFQIADQEIYLTVSVGVSSKPQQHSAELTLHQSSLALQHSQHTGKKFTIYGPDFASNSNVLGNITWLTRIKQALQEDRIVPYFQPIINNHTGQVEKFECLVRMIGPDGEVYNPGQFLSLAIRYKLYQSITQQMLRKCFATFRHLPYQFTVNFGAQDILESDTHRCLFFHLNQDTDTAKRLGIELLETEELDDIAQIKAFITDIRKYGCHVCIDDFGSGYSNLVYLVQLQVDILKIDGSLISHCDSKHTDRVLVNGIAQFAKNIGIRTVAEFVSSESILHTVMSLGIDYSQGYQIAPPHPEIHLDQVPSFDPEQVRAHVPELSPPLEPTNTTP